MKGGFYLLAAFLCLLAGAFIYLLYAPSVFFIRALFSLQKIKILQEKLRLLKAVFPDTAFIRYHLPDILWYQSLLILLIYFYHIKKIFHKGALYYLTLLLPFILEILQLLKVVPGTFDPMDIFFYGILLFSNYLFIFLKKKNEK